MTSNLKTLLEIRSLILDMYTMVIRTIFIVGNSTDQVDTGDFFSEDFSEYMTERITKLQAAILMLSAFGDSSVQVEKEK